MPAPRDVASLAVVRVVRCIDTLMVLYSCILEAGPELFHRDSLLAGLVG